jgi:hypothetical protein
VLVVVERADLVAAKSLRNVDRVHVLVPDQLNTYDVLVADDVVFTRGALDAFLAGPVKGKAPRRSRPSPRQPRSRQPRSRRRGRRDEGDATEGDAVDVERRGSGGRPVSSIHKDHRDVLLSPVVSEKSYGLLDENKYTFLVRPTPTRPRSRSRSRRSSASR